MKYLDLKIILLSIFFTATALLVLYLLSIRWHFFLPVILFWIAIALMLGTIIYQSLKIELYPSYAIVVLLEILITCLVFHLIYQIPYYGLHGFDPYKDIVSAKGILSSRFVMGDPQYINKESYFPIIHLFGVMISLITSLDLFSVAKWFPSLMDLTLILLLFLLFRSIFKEENIALISVLLFTCLQHHISFSSNLVRETIALIYAVCCIYLYFSAKHSPYPATNIVLSIVCLIVTVFTHHLTSFMLLIFLLIHFLVNKAYEIKSFQRAYFGDNIKGEKITTIFLSIAFIAPFVYWMHVVMLPLYSLITFVQDLFIPSPWGMNYFEHLGISTTTIQTIRGYIIFYGFFFFHLFFGFILLYGALTKVYNKRLETYSFILYLYLCGIMGCISLYIVMTGVSPHRFLMYGWIFGFSSLVVVILKNKYKWFKRIGIYLLIAFMFFNIYMINPAYWDARTEEAEISTSKENYILANTFDFSNGRIFGIQNSLMAIYDVHNNIGTIFSFFEVDLKKFDWVIIQRKELEIEKKHYPEPRTETIAALEHLLTGCSVDFNKIYESNNLLVFKLR